MAANKDYVKEYLYVLLLGLVFCVCVALITYDPADPSSFNLSAGPGTLPVQVSNTLGPVGAKIADWGFQLFGIGSIVFTTAFLFQLLNTMRRPKQRSRFWLRVFGYPQLIVTYAGLLSLLSPLLHFRGLDIYTGGLLGNIVASFCSRYLGELGAIVALSIAVLASFTLCLGIRPLSAVTWCLSFFPSRAAKDFAHTVKTIHAVDVPEAIVQEKSSPVMAQPAPQLSRMQQVVPAVTGAQLEMPTSFDQKVVTPEEFAQLVNLLEAAVENSRDLEIAQEELQAEGRLIEEKLASFGVLGAVTKSYIGPMVNVHEFAPAPGTKVNKILALQDDLSLALQAKSVLISLQLGKSSVGIAVAASVRENVQLKEILQSMQFADPQLLLPLALGKNVDSVPLIADLATMPHLLIAGATGSGKSICLHNILLSLMISKTPRQLRCILIDPKMLELSSYENIGHLLMPVITTVAQAASAFQWAVVEMERRYQIMRQAQVRNIQAYNTLVENSAYNTNSDLLPLPYLVIVVDELSDLILANADNVENNIQLLAQKARAAGIHLVLATQRPSADVITGAIKANLPCRLSFQVTSRYDSKVIIDGIGAESLLGQGDMLLLLPGKNQLLRAQCAHVTDAEITSVTNKLRTIYPSISGDMLGDIKQASNDLKQSRQKNDKHSSGASFYSDENNEIMNENTFYEKMGDIDSKNMRGRI